MIQRFCVAHNLDVMESMIPLFWVGTIFSLERKEKGLWVFICTISILFYILFVVFNATKSIQYRYMKVEMTVLDDHFFFK